MPIEHLTLLRIRRSSSKLAVDLARRRGTEPSRGRWTWLTEAVVGEIPSRVFSVLFIAGVGSSHGEPSRSSLTVELLLEVRDRGSRSEPLIT